MKSSYPAWAPRFWHGMAIGDWLRLIAKNRFRIHPLRWGLAATVTGLTAFNSSMNVIDRMTFGRRVRETKLVADPIFILGHWRSGTTFLHDLFAYDQRFATPTTFQCFAPEHFLVTEKWVPKLVWFLMPSKRPMDNVKLGWNEPQEDEFALCSMGLPSPYLRMAFPETGDQYTEWLDMREVDAGSLQEWQQKFDLFLRRLTFGTNKRLILKSPTHTGRLGLLHKVYPNAQFIHISRDPRSVLPSTVKLWDTLDEAQGLQIRKHDATSFILPSFRRMYDAFFEDRKTIPESQIVELRYEDLVANTVGEMQRIYEHLKIGDFDVVKPALLKGVEARKGYRTNQYQLSPEQQQQIEENFSQYRKRYSYPR